MAGKRASRKAKSRKVLGHPPHRAKTPLRAGLYARVSTQDQQTIPMQTRALREYASRRGWAITLQVKEIGSGASQRERREQLLEAARRREIDVVLVWRLDRWGRSVTPAGNSSGTGASGSRVRFADRGTGFDHAHRSSHGGPAGGLRGVRKGDSPRTSPRRLGPRPPERSAPGPTGNCGPPQG